MDNPDDLPIFRPKLGSGRRPSTASGARTFRNAVLACARGSGMGRGHASKAMPMRAAVTPSTASSRRVVVKAHLLRMTGRGAKSAAKHLHYIERDGVEKDGSKGVAYTDGGPAALEDFSEPRTGERHQFRFIISPEDAGELDLTRYVRDLVRRMELDVGRKLEWAAVNHYDTDHPHAHVVVRGVDRDGRQVRFDRAYISRGVRERAQELATRELGPRNPYDVQRTRQREVTQERLTSLDRELERRSLDHRVEFGERAPGPGGGSLNLIARLQHLEGMRLAERIGPTSWRLAPSWSEQLRELGERGDVLKQIHKAMREDPARYHAVHGIRDLAAANGGDAKPLTGRVVGKGLSDEVKGSLYAVIETATGHAYHVPLSPRAADAVRVGDLVTMESRPPARAAVSAEISKERGLSWHPHTLGLEAQTRYPGPVWLDSLDPRTLALDGFGAEVRRAREQRERFLREQGIALADPADVEKLREMARLHLGRDFQVRTGQVFESSVPDSFSGRLRVVAGAARETEYAVVSDGTRFVVFEATATVRALEGQPVVLRKGPGREFKATAVQDRVLGR